VRYIIVGNGSMSIKEIPDVLAELKPDADVVYVVAEGTRTRVGESILEREAFSRFYVALSDPGLMDSLPVTLVDGASDVFVWDARMDMVEFAPEVELIALLPSEDDPEDEFLEAVVDAAVAANIRCRAMNEQMYDLIVDEGEGPVQEEAPEPVQEEAPAEEPPVEIVVPTAAEMESMPRADLKALAKAVGAVPADWRSKAAIINAVLETQTSGDPYELPSEPDLDTIAAEVAELQETQRPLLEEAEEAPVQETIPELSLEQMSQVLQDLLGDIAVRIDQARSVLKEMR
jgi:hypothetical protein